MNLHITILVSLAWVKCVDEVVDNRASCQEYEYVYFLYYYTSTVIHFMNGEGVS